MFLELAFPENLYGRQPRTVGCAHGTNGAQIFTNRPILLLMSSDINRSHETDGSQDQPEVRAWDCGEVCPSGCQSDRFIYVTFGNAVTLHVVIATNLSQHFDSSVSRTNQSIRTDIQRGPASEILITSVTHHGLLQPFVSSFCPQRAVVPGVHP